MVNICLMNGLFPPDGYGGAENYVLRVAKELQKRGHTVSVLTTKPYDGLASLTPQRDELDGVTVFRFYPLNVSHRSEGTGDNLISKGIWHNLDTFNPHAKRVVARFLDRKDVDVVHTNNTMGMSSAVGTAIEEADVRFVHMLHDYSLICPKSNLLRERTLPGDEIGICENPPTPCQLYKKGKQRTMGGPDMVLSPSQHVIDVHQNHGLFTDVPTERVQHGVTEISDDVPDSDPEGAVLYVGKHLRAKGLETLFSAAELVPDVTFHLCGTGPYDETTEQVASSTSNIEYHGYVSEERLMDLRRRVAAAVVPSIWMENSPLVIYESFAQGLPVLASDVGGLPELVADDRGALFEPDDPEALSACIRTHLSDQEMLGHRREQALIWARNHTLSHHVSQLLNCYRATWATA